MALSALPAELARAVRRFLSLEDVVALVGSVARANGLDAFLPPVHEIDAYVADSALALRSERRKRLQSIRAAARPQCVGESESAPSCAYHNESLRRLLLTSSVYDSVVRRKLGATEALTHLEGDSEHAQRVAIEILPAQKHQLNRYALARTRVYALRNGLDRVVAWTSLWSIAESPKCFRGDLMATCCGLDGFGEESSLCREILQLAHQDVASYRLILEAAAEKGRLVLVLQLLDNDKLLSTSALEEALGSAASAGQLEVVDALLHAAQARNVDVDAANSLERACLRGHLSIVKTLTESRPSRFLRDAQPNAVLYAAVKGGNKSVVAQILADSRVNSWDPSSLQLAACEGNLEILQQLLEHPSCRKADIDAALRSLARTHLLSDGDRSNVVSELLIHMADRALDPSSCWEFIDVACAHGSIATIERMLGLIPAQGDRSDRMYWRPLVTAARHGHVEVVRRILDGGGCWRALSVARSLDGDTEVAEALLAACHRDDLRTAKLLLDRVDVDLLQLLRVVEAAAAAPTCSVLHWMLDAQPAVTSQCDLDAALQYACAHGRSGAARLLLAQSTVAFGDGQAIQFAATSGDVELVRLLLDDPRVDETYDVEAALVDASREGHAAIVLELLNDVRLSITTGAAFHAASENGHLHVLRTLMQAEVMWHNPLVLDLDVAFSRAARRGHYAVLFLLLNDPRVPFPRGGALTRVAELPKRPADPTWCKFLRRFFRHGRVDPAADGNQLLLDACLQGQRGVVDALLRSGRIQVSTTTIEAVNDLVRLSAGSVVRVPRRLARRYPLIAADLERHLRRSKRATFRSSRR